MRVCVYTAIYGGYDDLKPFVAQTVECDWLCFTDRPERLDAGQWRIIRAPRPEAHPRMQAKYFKLMSHEAFPGGRLARRYEPLGAILKRRPKYDALIWIDGCLRIKCPTFVEEFVGHIRDNGWAMFVHPDRGCIYDEATTCITMLKYQGLPVIEQVEAYRAQGYPERNGLMACTLIARSAQDKRLASINSWWWRENQGWTYQDQLSLPYVLWRLGADYDKVRLNLWDNHWFDRLAHASEL
jgi:hypothetical protein